jgi:hypothetical protein
MESGGKRQEDNCMKKQDTVSRNKELRNLEKKFAGHFHIA